MSLKAWQELGMSFQAVLRCIILSTLHPSQPISVPLVYFSPQCLGIASRRRSPRVISGLQDIASRASRAVWRVLRKRLNTLGVSQNSWHDQVACGPWNSLVFSFLIILKWLKQSTNTQPKLFKISGLTQSDWLLVTFNCEIRRNLRQILRVGEQVQLSNVRPAQKKKRRSCNVVLFPGRVSHEGDGIMNYYTANETSD